MGGFIIDCVKERQKFSFSASRCVFVMCVVLVPVRVLVCAPSFLFLLQLDFVLLILMTKLKRPLRLELRSTLVPCALAALSSRATAASPPAPHGCQPQPAVG